MGRGEGRGREQEVSMKWGEWSGMEEVVVYIP